MAKDELNTSKRAVQTVRKTVKLVRRGTIGAFITAYNIRKAGINKDTVKYIGKTALQNSAKPARFGSGYALKTGISAVKSARFTARGISAQFTAKSIGIGAGVLGSAVTKSDNTSVQAMGTGIKTAQIGGKTMYNAGRFGVRAVKTSVKRVKGAYRLGKSLKTSGVKNTAKKYAAKAEKAAVKLVVNLAKGVMSKLLVPIIIIIAVLAAVLSAASAPTTGIASVFGGVFSIFEKKDDGTEEYTDFDTTEFLRNAVIPLREDFAQNIADQADGNLVSDGGAYHYVRLFSEDDPENLLSEAKTGNNADEFKGKVLDSIDSADKLAQLLNPMFTVMVLRKYDLSPTQAQATDTVNELWNTIMKTRTADLPTEYCLNDYNADGLPHEDCGQYISNDDCPNHTEGTHSSFTCSICCYTTTERSASGYSSQTVDHCSGYSHCDGHKILAVYIDEDGYYELLNKYFYQPIEELANKQNRTDEENEQLQTLIDNAALCMDLINEMSGNTTDGAGNTDLSGVNFINGERAGNQAIVNLALQQANEEGHNAGGYKFWSDFGYKSRFEWCACFVSWCAKYTSYTPDVIPIFFGCGAGIQRFSEQGQWYAGNYSDPAPGDLIFFDWEKDGKVNHVGIVAGHDGERVYTVEGNSNDICATRSYPLTSGVIFGYALPNY